MKNTKWFKITTGLTFVKHRSYNLALGLSWFSGPTFRSLNLEVGHWVFSLKLDGGYGFRENYTRYYSQVRRQE